MSIILETSIGEAVDKLSILEIKLSKINDIRRIDVKKEYDYLHDKLNDFLQKYAYFYKILIKINEEIWNLQDIIRSENFNKINFNNTCEKILNLNDSRFLVKKKINELCNSTFKEQKGYKIRILNIVLDTEIEIVNNLNGAIRYYSFFYDEIYLFINMNIIKKTLINYTDDPFIKIKDLDDEINNENDFIKIKNINDEKYNINQKINHSFFVCTSINEIHTINNINDIYDKLNLDKKICDEYKN
jgi:hypothetical protein